MAKNLKLTIKNAQIANAVNLGGLKEKLANKKATAAKESPSKESSSVKGSTAKEEKIVEAADTEIKEPKEEAPPRPKARSRSAFAEPLIEESKPKSEEEVAAPIEPIMTEKPADIFEEQEELAHFPHAKKTGKELRKELFGEDAEEITKDVVTPKDILSPLPSAPPATPKAASTTPPATKRPEHALQQKAYSLPEPVTRLPARESSIAPKLGPTGRHVKDLVPPRPPVREEREARGEVIPKEKQHPGAAAIPAKALEEDRSKGKARGKVKAKEGVESAASEEEKKGNKPTKFKEFRDVKPAKRVEQTRFDARDRQGLRDNEEDQHWRKRRGPKQRQLQEDTTLRPTSLKVRIPIAIKDLAVEMKLKASQLIAKLFSQGVIATLNDLLEDETTIQLLGQEFGCEIEIDKTEEQRIRITDKTIREEVQNSDPANLIIRPPVVAFMGHVDHGKTSLIDAIRKTNRASGEAGAITQHIGAFRCSTPVGDIAILDTPGHEAFSAMRARGADVTDIVVLVIAGDEGMRQQTIEALNHAKAAKVTIVVALNKCDKPNFNADNVYRQLAEHELLPESWGGQTITVNCSAVTGEGIPQLLEMLALQAEILELKADPTCRARGTVLESEMHKGMGSLATVLVQNGTLNCGDALVFGQLWGRVKTMHDEYGRELQHAGPSTPIEVTGLSGLPEAGQEFIVVKNEKEARDIAEARMLGMRQVNLLQAKKLTMDNLMQQASETNKKILNIVLRADVQGSLEALKVALMKIESTKAELNIIFTGVGEISESDVQLAATSKAVIIGFHTQVESHAEALMKQLGVQIRLHNIIYHAIDDVKTLLTGLLDKIAQETDKGKAEVKAKFKSSQYGVIAGCIVTEGTIQRNHSVRLRRGEEIIWKGNIVSLKRVKEDVREVAKGLECGIVINAPDIQEGDILEAYEVTYITQEL